MLFEFWNSMRENLESALALALIEENDLVHCGQQSRLIAGTLTRKTAGEQFAMVSEQSYVD